VPPRGRLPALVERKLKEANMPLAETQIGNRTAFAASLMEGKGVVESHRRSVASQEIQALAAEIDARLNGRLAA
ncbi:MAG: ParA family protein, partial [Rhodospirillaceae bacterium]